MKRVRILLVLSVLALIVALVPAAAAQEETFGLSASDYALLTTANENTSAASSFDYTFTLTLNASTSGDVMNVALDGSGSSSEGFSVDLGGSLKASGETQPVQLSLRVVNDSLYVSMDNGETWYGSTLEELSAMGASMTEGLLPADTAALAEGDLSSLEGQMGDMSGMLTGLEGLDPASFISMSSAPAANGMTEFTINLDIATLLSTPEMAQLLGGAMSGTMGSGTGAAAATPSPQELQMMGSMFSSIFATSTATLTQVVDPASEHVVQTTLNFSLPLDAMGEAGDGVTLVFDVNLSNYGGATAVEAPASFESLTSMFSGAMGGM